MKFHAVVDGYRVEIRRGDRVVGLGRWTGERIEGGPRVLPGSAGEDETHRIYGELARAAIEAERAALGEAPAAEDDHGVDLTLLAWARRLSVGERLRMVGGEGYDVGGLLGVLSAHAVEFILVGGAAAVLQGAPIVTADVDFLYSQHPDNVERLLGALEELDAIFRDDLGGRRIRPNRTHLSAVGEVQRLQTLHGPLDLLSVAAWPSRTVAASAPAPELTYEVLLGDALVMEVSGLAVRVASLERIIEAKRIAGRPKDLLAIAELEAVLRARSGG
jgi:hypothetical protein